MMSSKQNNTLYIMDNFPQETDFIHPTSHPVKNEKKNTAPLIGAGLTAVLVIGVFLMVKNANKSQENRSDASVGDAEYVIRDVAPWGYAYDDITPEPQPLTPEQYNEIYTQVRKAFVERDYNAFKNLASPQRAWNVDHPVDLVQPPEGFNKAGVIKNIPGPENFFKSVIPGIQFQALPLDMVRPVSVVKRPAVNSSYLTQETDNQIHTKTNVQFTAWKYAVDVKYEPVENSIDKGKGQVTFVYDKDHWAYHGEFWEIVPHTTPIKAGDDVSATVELDMSSSPIPNLNVNITEGQAVSWKNISGMVYSSDPSVSPWNSYYLYNDTFTKKFLTKGTYQYKILFDKNGDTNVLDGVVNVQ